MIYICDPRIRVMEAPELPEKTTDPTWYSHWEGDQACLPGLQQSFGGPKRSLYSSAGLTFTGPLSKRVGGTGCLGAVVVDISHGGRKNIQARSGA